MDQGIVPSFVNTIVAATINLPSNFSRSYPKIASDILLLLIFVFQLFHQQAAAITAAIRISVNCIKKASTRLSYNFYAHWIVHIFDNPCLGIDKEYLFLSSYKLFFG